MQPTVVGVPMLAVALLLMGGAVYRQRQQRRQRKGLPLEYTGPNIAAAPVHPAPMAQPMPIAMGQPMPMAAAQPYYEPPVPMGLPADAPPPQQQQQAGRYGPSVDQI